MGKKYRNLMDRIVDDDNLRRAYKRTLKGRRMTRGALAFKEHAEANLDLIAADLRDGRYEPDPPKRFWIFEPKPRLITAQSFRDRVVHHALCAVIGPIFEATLLPRTFACRTGMGTHAGVRLLQADLRRTSASHFLKTDFSKFFPSIDRAILREMIARKISCRATLDLIGRIVPPTGLGLPIGALTSQLFANVYGGAVDRLLAQTLGERLWYRYMDDIVVLGDDPDHLRQVKNEIERFSADRLGLRFSKWSVQPVLLGINFLGYRVWPRHKLLRRQSVVTARRRLRHLIERRDDGAINRFLGSWLGHAAHADAHHLLAGLGMERTVS
jgi:retron-type reverse transcriptase